MGKPLQKSGEAVNGVINSHNAIQTTQSALNQAIRQERAVNFEVRAQQSVSPFG